MGARVRLTDVADGSAAERARAVARYGVPDIVHGYVRRPRLLDHLARAESVPLVLVSAPAGTGKTSLVAEWVRTLGDAEPTGWLTFEADDTAFWPFLITCLNHAGLVDPLPIHAVTRDTVISRGQLAALAAVIAESPRRLTIVLDGYEMNSMSLAHDVDFLVQHAARRLRLVMIGRVDPVLPLYTHRLAGSVLEVRVADLAFTDEEAATLVANAGVRLTRESVHDLNERIRGWAVGLRLAARALAGCEDPASAVATVVEHTSDINEYLVGEVLDAQTPEIRRFLLETSVADVLSPEIVEALAGPTAAQTLSDLARVHAFVEPVPNRPGCYRYYPFFRDLLHAHLAYESPETMKALHRVIAGRFHHEGLLERSIDQLALIGAWSEISTQMVDALALGRLVLDGPDGPLFRVCQQIPDDVRLPAACVVRAGVALVHGDELVCAEQLSCAREATGRDPHGEGALSISIAVLEALRATFTADAEFAGHLTEEAERALLKWHLGRGDGPGSEMYALVQLSKGISMFRRGDARTARAALTAGARLEAARAYPAFRADCLAYLALLDAVEGRLVRARRTAAESLKVTTDAGTEPAQRPPAAHVALALAAIERFELDAAVEHVTSAMESQLLQDDPISRSLAECVRADLERSRGNLRPALARLEAAAGRASSDDPWLADLLRTEAAKLCLASGQAELARSQLGDAELGGRPSGAAVAAAAYAEEGRDADVEAHLTRARNGHPPLGVRVSQLLTEAMLESERGSPGRARAALARSLRIAAPEEMRRPFREAGPSAQRLLAAHAPLLREHAWLAQPRRSTRPARGRRHTSERPVESDQTPQIWEPLTAKEVEVLGHLEELLTTEEIADRMFVSVNTVRTHIRNILRKLGVSRRNAAVRRARDLGMVKA